MELALTGSKRTTSFFFFQIRKKELCYVIITQTTKRSARHSAATLQHNANLCICDCILFTLLKNLAYSELQALMFRCCIVQITNGQHFERKKNNAQLFKIYQILSYLVEKKINF